MVVEADESDGTFLRLPHEINIITNLDLEHLDCYSNLDDLQLTFIDFANKIPFYGKVDVGLDSENIKSIINKIKKPVVTFGFDKN